LLFAASQLGFSFLFIPTLFAIRLMPIFIDRVAVVVIQWFGLFTGSTRFHFNL
jgi:hypothetical protein